MSTTATTTEPPTTTNSKKQLFADFVAFSSIVSSYFLVSLTLHFNIFESQFGLALNSYSTIIILYLSYAALITTFKAIAFLLSFLSKGPQRHDFSSWLDRELNFSMLNVLVVSSLYIFVHISSRPFTLQQLCHIALYLWISEVFKLFGAFFGRLTGVTSLDYLGKSLGVILLLGALLQPLGLGIFTIF